MEEKGESVNKGEKEVKEGKKTTVAKPGIFAEPVILSSQDSGLVYYPVRYYRRTVQ